MLQDGVITRPGGAGPDVPQRVQSLHEDDDGHVWVGTWGRGVMRWDGVSWQTYSTADGLAGRDILSMYSTTDGDLWLGTGFWYRGFWQGGNGLSRFVGRSLATLEDLADVWALAEDSTGAIWIGNMAETRIVREGDVETVPVSDVWGMVADADGMWLNSRRQGLWRYEDGALKDISTARGLPQSGVSVLKDSRGRLWAGWQNDGVSILVGDRVEHLSTSDDSPTGYVGGVAEDRAGNIWIASSNGLSRYDETGFTRYLGRRTSSVLVTGKGHVWAGSFQSGAFHLRPGREAFELLTAADGLGHTSLTHVAQSRDGHLWFSTYGGGVTRYDGTVFQTLLTEDGLPSNAAQGVSQATNGDIWIATDGGATRFRPSPTPPPVEITGAVADRALDVGSGRIRVPVTQTYLAIEFQGSSLKTRPNQLVYLYRMVGHDSDWRQTRARRAVYEDLPVGDYTFQVQAVDRDLDYSELPATLQVQIHPNWGLRALQAGLTAALGAALLAAVWATRRRRERDQAREQLVQELEDELQTARKLQMSLMPESTPSIPGLDVAGRCLPVNHVCGDFFQYFVRNGSLSICMADVTGHAMEAAVPVMMFSGILETEMRLASPLDELFGHLNQTLHHKLDRRTYVCFTMGELQIHQPDTRRLRLANCGCPYPYHYQAANGEVAELQMDAYPLGIRPETEYRIIETRLSSGDCLVFCSDGIIEAGNAQEEIFGFERTEEAIRQGCREDQSAEELIDRLIGAVKAFTGDAPQGDDMTVVVLKVEA